MLNWRLKIELCRPFGACKEGMPLLRWISPYANLCRPCVDFPTTIDDGVFLWQNCINSCIFQKKAVILRAEIKLSSLFLYMYLISSSLCKVIIYKLTQIHYQMQADIYPDLSGRGDITQSLIANSTCISLS